VENCYTSSVAKAGIRACSSYKLMLLCRESLELVEVRENEIKITFGRRWKAEVTKSKVQGQD
jgi:hypothetical protein